MQYLVVKEILRHTNTATLRMLHFAPEPVLRTCFSRLFTQYETADLSMAGVHHHVDLQQLPFDDRSYDLVFASHVLEHIPDDDKAIAEIHRVLRPNGIAILPVPIVSSMTIEYPAPYPLEEGHVRAPGLDYFKRYERYFAHVEQYRSDSLPEKHQLYIYENRSRWPTKECPLRTSMPGKRHFDIVPVCYV